MFSLPDLLPRWRKRPAVDVADIDASAAAPPPAPDLLGCVSERSTRHVAGWLHNPADPAERVEFEVVCTLPGAERTVARGRAHLYNRMRELQGMGDAAYGFRVLFPEITDAEREHLEVRPLATGRAVQHDPNLRTRWEPLRFVAMDIVDNCNLRCPFCCFDYTNVHTTNLMQDEVYEKALGLLPLVGADKFWLSCLHEPTMHPKLTEYIARIPRAYRNNVFYTTNLARRMRPDYYETLAESGLNHLNISLESRDPAIYERMRKGARYRIFEENWDQLLRVFNEAAAPPPLHYVILAYKSNLREIPELVDYLRNERRGGDIAVRCTYDQPHIPAEFKAAEYLEEDDWRWLQGELARFPADKVVLALPSELVPPTPLQVNPDSRALRQDGAFCMRLTYDGTMWIYPALADETLPVDPETAHVARLQDIADPAAFLLSL